MQGQGGKQLYNGPIDVVRKLYAEGGLKSVFRGTGATLARDGPGSAAYVLHSSLSISSHSPTIDEPRTKEEGTKERRETDHDEIAGTLLRTNWSRRA